MTRALRRFTAMQPGELQFRLTCEVRKGAGRVRHVIAGSQWSRAALVSALDSHSRSKDWAEALSALRRRDHLAAHRSLARHFRTRSTPFPLGAARLPDLASAVGRDFPGSRADASTRADAVTRGRYDLLGFKGLELGPLPDWHRDGVSDRRSPLLFWSAVPYLDALAGDHKVIWELNRHQHWLVLGRAHALTGDRRYYDLFTSQLASWLAANPPLLGTNWASMLELGFRSLAWLWSLELFAGAAGDTDREPWLVDLLVGLDRQLTHVEHNLSLYFSPNTHLTGEALALYVGGLALPELRASARRTSVGRDVLVQEASRQIRADGGHAELSAHYHRYSTDFYLLAAIVARHAADPAAGIFEEAARRQARFLRTIADDGGIRPQIGDDDGGQCFPICGRDAADCRDTLATAAVLLDEPALAIGPVPEETYWMCGLAAADALPGPAGWTSAALPASGYFVSRTAHGDQLIVDAGPHGFLNGGHAHSDALSSVLTVAGRPLLIDPGTATYTMDYEVRDQFRSTMMHNTVVLDGQPQSRPRGAFHWATATSARASIWRTSSDCDYIEGTHNGYAPRVHTRAVLALHGLGWWFFDFVLGSGTADIECYWHIDPSWHCTADSDHVVRLRSADRSLALASTAATQVIAPGAHPLASRSPAYGVIEPAPLLVGRLTAAALPTTIATFIPATPEVGRQLVMEESRIHTAPGPDWHGCAFRVRWSAGAMLVLAAVEAAGAASRDTSAPPHRWGTSGMQTDARVAALIDYSMGRSEAVLVNGALVSAHSTHRLVNLPRPVPLLRMSASALAPSMHEVGAGLEP